MASRRGEAEKPLPVAGRRALDRAGCTKIRPVDELEAEELLEHLATQPLPERADAFDKVIDALERDLEATAHPGPDATGN